MSAIRKAVIKLAVKLGIVDKVGPVKGPLARKKAMDRIRPNIKGRIGEIVATYKGKNRCKVKLIVNREPKVYDAIMNDAPSRIKQHSYYQGTTGGFNTGDKVVVLGWDGLSSSVLEVALENHIPIEIDRGTIQSTIGKIGYVIEVYENMFVKVGHKDYRKPFIAQYQGYKKPKVREEIRFKQAIGNQLMCEPVG